MRPILMPDTSVINCLADDPDSVALIAGLNSGYFVRFPFTTASEIVANSSGVRRKQLLGVCRRLLSAGGDCIEPHHEIIKTMVARFENSLPLGAEHVNLRMAEAEEEILRAMSFDDDLATQEREESRTNDKAFRGVYADAKDAFEGLAAAGVQMPGSVAGLVSQLQEGGAFWTLAQDLYERVATKPTDNPAVRRFYAECEPFRALMIALVVAQYDRCIRQRSDGRSLKSGRNNTFMATCLPYCDQFVTNDEGQMACYREVVSLAGIEVTIRSYREFRDSFFIMGATAGSAK